MDQAIVAGIEVEYYTSDTQITPPVAIQATREPGSAATKKASPPASAPAPEPPSAADVFLSIKAAIKGKPQTADALLQKVGITADMFDAAIEHGIASGATVVERGGKFHLDDAPMLGSMTGNDLVLMTDDKGWLKFGACSDEHLCSKHERLDCLNDYYDQIEERGITTVLNAGNWIDGEARFNTHELLVHGMDNQMRYLAKNYPQRKGVKIHAITGEDHEGWYSRREGIDVGKYAENIMREQGRTDWNNLGFMEAFVPVVSAQSGKSSQICVMHPGGGSSYAVSYTAQKLVESFDGGSKPAVLLIGHYHKSNYGLFRNVHTLQTGCFMDQSIFMRKKRLAAHVGGWFCEIHIDPRTGAVDEARVSFRNYYDRGYYNGQWSQSGDVVKAPKSWKAVG